MLVWVDLKFLSESKGHHKEIYLKQNYDFVEGLIFLFYNLFGSFRKEIYILDIFWWNFNLEIWNAFQDEYD